VTLNVDASVAFRTPQALADLVSAVIAASDESDWIEWKRTFDLRTKETWATISRHILGMANRRTVQAEQHAQGCSYIVVGAEPGDCPGVDGIDPADLGRGLESYLGADGPRWGLQYVQHDNQTVLIVTVEPPRSGDRIFTLRKDFGQYRGGAVFVRGPGRTDLAGPDDIRVLEERFATGAASSAKHEQLIRDLRDVGNLVERIASLADEPAQNRWFGLPRWRCEEQNRLDFLLVGIDLPLPKCRALIGENGANAVLAAAREARNEIKAALRQLTEES
jgi:hypothetical protein